MAALLPSAVLVACLASAPGAGPVQEPAGDTPELELPPFTLPDGPAARAWAGVGATTEPNALPAAWGELDGPRAWERAATWTRWADLVEAEGRAADGDPAARAGLFVLALRQGRTRDAWTHFARLTASPGWAARVLPLALPGVGAAVGVGAGGRVAPLPDGALLQPALPPTRGDGGGPGPGLEWGRAVVRGLRVGDALVDLSIGIEADGVQVDLDHRGGGPARVAVLLPEPEGYRIRAEYNDWFRQETLREPLVVELAPGDETHSLFGRLIERAVALPGPAQRVPEQIREGELWLADEPEDAPQAAVAARTPVAAVRDALARLCGVVVRVRSLEPGAEPAPFGTRVELPADAAERAARLRYLAGAVERLVLRAPDAPR